MADDKKTKIAEDFGKELDVLQDKLNNMTSFLGAQMRNKLQDLATDAGNFVSEFEKGGDVTKQLSSKLTTIQKDLNKLSINRLKLENDLARVQQQGNVVAERKIRAALMSNKLSTQQIEAYQTQLIKLAQIAEEEKKITEEKKKQDTLAGALKDKFAEQIKVVKQFGTVAGLLGMIIDGALRFNKTSVEISKNIGYGAGQANMMALKMEGIAATSSNLNVTMKNLGEAIGDLNKYTGGVANYSADALETQVMLTKQFGLTGEEAAGIYKFSVLTGKSSSTINKEMVAAFASTRNMVKGSADFRATIAEAAKVSGQLAANFRNNPAEITKAVVQAQALGTTLEKTKSQGEKLLDFESSIESELKAELLTGQQMNLERARAAALQGDQVTVMKELANQGMTIQKFQSMNVLAQESFAKALGLTADELSNQLNKQKIAQEQGKSLAQINAEEAEQAQRRQNVQDRFNALMEKLMDIIGKIGILLQPVFWLFEKITDNSWILYTVLGLIALSRLPIIAKAFGGVLNQVGSLKKGIIDAFKGDGVKGFFSKVKEGFKGGLGGAAKKSQFAGGSFSKGKELLAQKQAETAETAAGTGGKAGAGGPKAGEGIKNTLKGIADGIKAFKEVEFKDILKLGLSALALVALTPAVPALLLLQLVNGKLIEGVLTGLGKGLAELGKSLANGEVILGLAVFTLAMIGLGFALKLATPAIEAFGNVILKVFTGIGIVIKAAADGISTIFKTLGDMDIAHLLAIGPALMGIGLGLASLGAGGVIAAIGSFLGGDPIKKIERLAASGDGLQKAATGLQGVATALTQVATALAAIDTSKLEALGSFSTKMSIGSVAKGITDFITAPIKAVGEAIGGGGAPDNAPMVAAINEVRDAVNKLYAKNMDIYLDSTKVGSTLTQNSPKAA